MSSLLRGWSPTLWLGMALVLVPGIGALLAPWVAGASPQALSNLIMHTPGGPHPMGTDDLGRDMLARTLYGGRISLLVGLSAAVISVAIGTTMGALAGYFGGRLDDLLMRFTEAFQIVPRFLLAVVVVALFGPGWVNVILVIALLSWPAPARIIRSRVLTLRHEEFVLAAVLGGASSARVIVRHVLPNVLPYVVVAVTLQAGGAILTESFLSFLGLGDASVASWGLLLQQAQLYLQQAWWMSLFPGIFLSATILGLNLMGDGIAAHLGVRR
jgi:peptide/nickel transport system permease protein